MVIFNGKEMSSRFVRNGQIVEINSPIKDIPEALEEMRRCVKEGEPLSSFYISTYNYGGDGYKFEPISKDTFEWNKHFVNVDGTMKEVARKNVFDLVLTETEANVLEDDAAVYKRPKEFVEYERFQFNQTTPYNFKPAHPSNDEILYEFMSAYGILPTIWNEDRPINELLSLSKSGENLVRMYNGSDYEISKFNAAPPLEWIESYQKLSPYEKRVVQDGRIHPAKIMQIAKGLKEISNDYLIRKEFVDYIYANHSDKKRVTSKDVIEHFSNDFAKENESCIALAEEVFKENFHGRAPRVLSEYMEGALAARGIKPSEMTREQVDEIVSKFNQGNVSRVAKYRNPVLLALSEKGKVNFANQKDAVLQAIGATISVSSLNDMFSKQFPEWLDKHPDARPEEVLKICSLLPEIDKINVNDSAKEIIAKIELKDGYTDARRFEEKSIYASQGYKFENNEVAIRGRNIVCKQGNLTMRMLSADDYKNFMVGKATHCCQRFGDAGESCVYKYTSDPFAACVVIERGDKIVAQGFVWTDELNDTFVFDNVELDNDREVQQFSDLFAAYAKALPYANVHVGTGYNQGMNGWGDKVGFDKKNKIFATMPTTIDGRTNITNWGDGNCYTDYHTTDSSSLARVIKHLGGMRIKQNTEVQVDIKPDEPTKWDELAKPDLNFMLNDWRKTPEERLEIAKKFRENPTPELQLEIIKTMPQAVGSLEHPSEEVQMYILNNEPSLIWKIKEPCFEVQKKMVSEDPAYLTAISNPPEELVLEAISKDGGLISIIEDPSEEACKLAVAQNGFAIKYIPIEKQTSEVQVAAVENEPKSISLIQNPSVDALLRAVEKKPEVVSLLRDIPEEVQMTAVSERPSVVNMIKNPSYGVVSEAVHHNGLMVRNFQSMYPDLREVAVRQNGFAIRCLKSPTIEEVRLAVEQNPKAISAIKNEELLTQIRSEYPEDYFRNNNVSVVRDENISGGQFEFNDGARAPEEIDGPF